MLCEQQFGLFDGVNERDMPVKFPAEFAYYDMLCRFGGKFWARMPQGESRFDVAKRVHQAFGTFHRDASDHGIHDIVVICHGVTLRAFVMMWCHLSPEWFEAEPNPANCAVRLIDSGEDKGYLFAGFARS
jgi:2,3-bisphosphoglycerate-dependent phosphoglycerate mutase